MSDQYFSSKTYPVDNSHKAIFFFVGFGTKVWLYKLIFRKLNKLGYTVIAYDFPNRQILKSNGYFLEKIRAKIQSDIKKHITKLSPRGYTRFDLIGVSMGAVFGVAFTKETPEISKVVLITMYGSCAQHIWEYKRLKDMKKSYTDKGLSMEDVQNLHPNFEPLVATEKLQKKEILLYASREDNVILYTNTQRFITKAKEIGIKLNVIEGSGRHIPFITRTLLKDKNWANFLAS